MASHMLAITAIPTTPGVGFLGLYADSVTGNWTAKYSDGSSAMLALSTIALTAGAGLAGGGDLSSNRIFAIVANADGSIIVNPDDIQVGVINDVQHGARSGGAQHSNVVAAGAAGFMTGADKSKLDSLFVSIGQRLATNATTTVVTATSTNLSFAIGANEIWRVEIEATVQCSGTGGTKYAIAAPAAATVEGWIKSSVAAINTLSYQRITAVNTLNTTALHTVATTPGPDTLSFTISNGGVAGTVTLQIASVTAGQTTTVFAGSSLVAVKVTNV